MSDRDQEFAAQLESELQNRLRELQGGNRDVLVEPIDSRDYWVPTVISLFIVVIFLVTVL